MSHTGYASLINTIIIKIILHTYLSVIFIYFILLLVVGRIFTRTTSNDVFFRAEGKSPWYVVAFGMIGASISGVTFISVPGMVISQDMTYLQMCLGFIVGYFLVAFVLLPIYYRLHLTTIYTYLRERLGPRSYKTGSAFFFLSKMAGAAVRFYIVCLLLQTTVFDSIAIPFPVTAIMLVLMIWLYTKRGGIKAIVYTDFLQTFVMFATLIMILASLVAGMDMSVSEAVKAIAESEHSRIFVFDDWTSKQNFWKQFLSGIFVVIVMTGLDQDMMQKNLTCQNLKDAQKNLCSYSFAFVPANLICLSLGVLLLIYSSSHGIPVPERADDLLPGLAATGILGNTVAILFTIGIVASAFSSADSALTALTTTLTIDLFHRPADEAFRKKAHIVVIILFIISVMAVKEAGSSSVINTIYVLCGYTYGPLLGLFLFSIITSYKVFDRYVPIVCICSPLICFLIDRIAQLYGYSFGYELLMLNGLLTFSGCFLLRQKR